MICAREDCGIEFSQKTHNQKYCSDECCRIATNKRIMEKYYEKKAIRNGAKRVCKTRGCGEILSRYNYASVCFMCESRKKSDAKRELLDIINVIGKTK